LTANKKQIQEIEAKAKEREKKAIEREKELKVEIKENIKEIKSQIKEDKNSLLVMNIKNAIGEIKQSLQSSNKIHFFFETLKKNQIKQKELRDELKSKADKIRETEMNIVININLAFVNISKLYSIILHFEIILFLLFFLVKLVK
jgi:hypothetical protein